MRLEPSNPDLQGSNATLSALLAHPTDAVAAVRGRSFVASNSAWLRSFGVGEADFPLPVASAFVTSPSAERLLQRSEQASSGAPLTHVVCLADGRLVSVEILIRRLDPAEAEAMRADAIWSVRPLPLDDARPIEEWAHIAQFTARLSDLNWNATLVVDRSFRITYVGGGFSTVMGWRPKQLLGLSAGALVHPDDLLPSQQVFSRLLGGAVPGPDERFIVRVREGSGGYRRITCRVRNGFNDATLAGVMIELRDPAQEERMRQAEEERKRYAARLSEALFALATVASIDAGPQIQRILDASVRELGVHSAGFWRYRPEARRFDCEHASLRRDAQVQVSDPMRSPILEDYLPVYVRMLHSHRPVIVNDVQAHAAVTAVHLERLVAANVGAMLDFPVTREGETLGVLSIEWAATPRLWTADEIAFAAGLSLLIALALESAERAAEAARTEYLALHDALTGLANRTQGERALREGIAAAGRSERSLALLLVDLDDFKEINDNYGHGRGDELLREVAAALLEGVAGRGLVARMGGDEFLILLPEAHASEAERLAQDLVDRIGDPAFPGHGEWQGGASIGIAMFPEDGLDAEALLAHADIALYQAKELGRNRFFTFNGKLAQRLRQQRELDAAIRDALREGQFSVFYQPQFDLSSGAVIGMEALLRWEHPARGLLLPPSFMGAVRNNGLIDEVTKWTLSAVCDQHVRWREEGLGRWPMSINVTGAQFHDRRLPAVVAQALMRSGMAASDLILEVSEEHLMQSTRSAEHVLGELRHLGIRIAIDDFGVGYSSLSYLRKQVGSQIKLERAFIERLPHDSESTAIVAAVISIARQLQYQVVAEGVETREQAEYLREVGCHAGQGFYFAAPLSETETGAFLREHSGPN